MTESAETTSFSATASGFVRYCRAANMKPAETIACLSVAIAMAVHQSGNEWGRTESKALEDVIQMALETLSAKPEDGAS